MPESGIPEKRTASYAVPAVDAMLDIVELLADNHRPYGVTELARTLHISTNSVFRIMRCLTDRGYAAFDTDHGTYQLSSRFFSLGSKISRKVDLYSLAHPQLEWLSEQTGETSQILVPDGERTLVLDVVPPKADFFFQVVPGSRVYWHASAFGKIMLACMQERRVREILAAAPMPELTCNTITDKEKFIEHLAEVRRKGLAYDWEEYNAGVYCIGAAVRDVEGNPIAGIGMTGLVARFSQTRREELEQFVVKAAETLSRQLGYYP